MEFQHEDAARHGEISRFFEDAFQERLNRSPQRLTSMGDKSRHDQLDDFSAKEQLACHGLLESQLQRLLQFDPDALDPAESLNYRIFKRDVQDALDRFRFRFHGYLLNHKVGLHTDFPAFMINKHGIDNLRDAQDYIGRLNALPQAWEQVTEGLEIREDLGIIPPAFLFPQMISDCRRFIGAKAGLDITPDVERNVLYEDFRAKIDALDSLSSQDRRVLLNDARAALETAVMPTYAAMIGYLEQLAEKAPPEAGASTLPDGEAYYQCCLRRHTSTNLSADEIHQLGLDEVARLEAALLQAREQLGFGGRSLQELYDHARQHPGFHYTDDRHGRQRYLDDLNHFVEKIQGHLPQLFVELPQDPLQIRAVERHRERTAGLAFYEGPAADGSRPGIFHVNLHDPQQLPTHMLESLAYHEGLPGHHLQFSIANRLSGIPTFRRYLDCTAYIEGWGMYSERFPKELGLYQEVWSDFGRVLQELKRACRLVVDTGLHARGWTRQQAINYLYAHGACSIGQITKEVDRYIVMPGQATSYMIGLHKILSLRSEAQSALGEHFNIRRFHDELLKHGPIYLDTLQELVTGWVTQSMRQVQR